ELLVEEALCFLELLLEALRCRFRLVFARFEFRALPLGLTVRGRDIVAQRLDVPAHIADGEARHIDAIVLDPRYRQAARPRASAGLPVEDIRPKGRHAAELEAEANCPRIVANTLE